MVACAQFDTLMFRMRCWGAVATPTRPPSTFCSLASAMSAKSMISQMLRSSSCTTISRKFESEVHTQGFRGRSISGRSSLNTKLGSSKNVSHESRTDVRCVDRTTNPDMRNQTLGRVHLWSVGTDCNGLWASAVNLQPPLDNHIWRKKSPTSSAKSCKPFPAPCLEDREILMIWEYLAPHSATNSSRWPPRATNRWAREKEIPYKCDRPWLPRSTCTFKLTAGR